MRPPYSERMKRSLLIAVGAGIVLGAGTRFVYELPREWWWLARVGGPWLAFAFGTGLTTRKAVNGAVAGCACLVTATLVYYGIMGLLQHAYETSPLGLAWLFVAVPTGLGFGALGAAARSPALRLPTPQRPRLRRRRSSSPAARALGPGRCRSPRCSCRSQPHAGTDSRPLCSHGPRRGSQPLRPRAASWWL
jgi:hypothetical protein